MSNYELVKNNYKQDGDLLLRFEYDGQEYHVEMRPYLLAIKNSRDEEYYRQEVYSYYDCLAFNNGCLYFGDRHGRVHVISMMKRKEILRLFLNEEAERFYRDHINMYPSTLPYIIQTHQIGDYDYLPELHVMNEVVSHLSVSSLHAWGKYVVFGDLSGRVSIFDTSIMKVVKTLKVNGAVSFISDENGAVIIDFITDDHFDSPQSLARYENAKRIYLELD